MPERQPVGKVALAETALAETVFSCYAPSATKIFLAGTFNNWNPDALPLHKDEDGNWSVSIPLEPGRYEYKFVVDSTWCCKPGCHDPGTDCRDCIRNDFDTMNRVLIVGQPIDPKN